MTAERSRDRAHRDYHLCHYRLRDGSRFAHCRRQRNALLVVASWNNDERNGLAASNQRINAINSFIFKTCWLKSASIDDGIANINAGEWTAVMATLALPSDDSVTPWAQSLIHALSVMRATRSGKIILSINEAILNMKSESVYSLDDRASDSLAGLRSIFHFLPYYSIISKANYLPRM